MPSVKTVEQTILRIERFPVKMRHPTGRDVRSDRTKLPPYPYRKAMKKTATVRKWREDRFLRRYPGFAVDVVDDKGRAAHGKTLLSTLREMHSGG